MNVLFAHDHKFSVDENGKVYSYLMDHNMWDRYLPFFDSITIVARRINISSKNPKQMKGMKSAQADRVNFSLLGETINNDGSINKKPDQFQKYKAIKNLVSKSDCVIARLPSIIGYMACREAIKQHKKYAVEVVACAWDSNWYHGGKINKIMALPSFFVMKHYVKHANFAIYVTDHFLQHRYPCNGKTGIASNVSIDAVEHEVLDKRIDHIKSLKHSDKIIFGIVGPLHVNFKGHKTAILALSKAKNNIPPFELRCIGAGDPKRWQQLANNVGIGENIFFDGLLKSGKPVADWMDNIDILLIPSLQEGLPRALIEAMSRGIPCLGAITGGIPQLLNNKYLHKKNDYNKLCQDIINLVNNKNEMIKCAKDNYTNAQRYIKPILDKNRSDFWKQFSDNIKS